MHLSVRLPANTLKTGKPSGAFFKRGIESPIRYRYISKSSLNPSQSSPRPYIPEAPQDWSFQFRLVTGSSGTIPDMKRSSSGSVPATQSTSKKRKTDSGPKYYAVKAGFRPGVYATYAECSAQTAGFKGAVFKSFTSRTDAEDFAAGKVVATPNEPAKFYAVAVGNPTGIYGDWSEAAKAITGVKGPKYKKFASRAEAVDYIKQFGNKEAIEALGEKFQTTSRPEKKTTSKAKLTEQLPLADGIVRVYTDGSSLANGKAGSRAGVGVYFGDGDARNISERLEGEPQTNQRAELMAMLRALQVVPLTETVQIFSDSQYSINCVTQWAIGWKKKDWKTANGDDVKNQDIIRVLLNKMDERAKVGANTLFQWVKGHATDKGNVAADRLAVAGAKMSLTM